MNIRSLRLFFPDWTKGFFLTKKRFRTLYRSGSAFLISAFYTDLIKLFKNIVDIHGSENVSSPFVLGIINPRIYLPFSMNEQDLEHVVREKAARPMQFLLFWKL